LEQHSVYAPNTRLLFENIEGAKFINNFYYSGVKKIENRPKGENDHLMDDIKFIDPVNNDFRLQKDLPIFGMGFRPFDPSKAGRITHR
jgi:hypothetical protein